MKIFSLAIVSLLMVLTTNNETQDNTTLNGVVKRKPKERYFIFSLLDDSYSDDNNTILSDNCKIVINEINVNDPQKPEKREFIELKVSNFTFNYECIRKRTAHSTGCFLVFLCKIN